MIEEFISVTGASVDEAENWLEVGCFVLEDAIELFFSSKQPNSSVISNKLDKDTVYDEVRRPDEVKRQRLVDTSSFSIQNKVNKTPVSAFTSGKDFIPRNDKDKTIANLYKPPHDLMTLDNFEGVVERARGEDRWLLVNIQRDSEFQCHLLNRDFWSDESVRDMVMCSFVFWQQLDTSDAGALYVQRYKIVNYPHIAILDPRTGAISWRHDGDVQPKSLAEKLQDFLGLQAMPSEAATSSRAMRKRLSNSLGHSTASANGSSSNGAAEGTSSNSGGLSEEEELERAIHLSLGHQQENSDAGPVVLDAEPNVLAAPPILLPVEAGVSGKIGFALSEFDVSAAQVLEAPHVGGQQLKFNFRLPGGSKVNHAFDSNQPVSAVICFAVMQIVEKNVPQPSGAAARIELQYNYPYQQLSELSGGVTQTLAESGIVSGTSFSVRFL